KERKKERRKEGRKEREREKERKEGYPKSSLSSSKFLRFLGQWQN
ncbi:hypothetical protein EGK_16373, partial [Macaca mulatta]